MSRIKATFNNVYVDEAKPEDCAIDSDYVIPKMLPEHFGTGSYTFSSNPTNTTVTMFEVDFSQFDYLPMGYILIENTTDAPGLFAILAEMVPDVPSYVILNCLNFDGAFRTSETLQKIYAVLDRSERKLKVYYSHSHTTQAGYTGTVCPTTNVNGKKFTFRYYIFVEGDDDEDMIDISTTI